MSQRFGRNQRRRAREAQAAITAQVEDLRYANEMNQGLLRDYSGKLSHLRAVLDEAKELAGYMSFLFPAEEIVKVPFGSTDKAKVQMAEPQRMAMGPSSFDGSATANWRQQSLESLIGSIRQDALDQHIHVKLEFADHVFAYGISMQAWRAMPDAQKQRVMEREIPKTLAQHISRQAW